MKLKFRGLSAEPNEEDNWKYGYLIEDGREAFIINQVIEANEQYITIGSWDLVRPDTVSQSTGSVDKKNKEIYEGNPLQIDSIKAIVRFGKYRYYEEKEVLSGNGFYLECLNVMDPDCISPYEPDVLDKAEIIGNIFENPTLEYHFIGLRPKEVEEKK